MTARNAPQKTSVGAPAHFGVGTKRPVGRNRSVRISTTEETMIACDGLTQSAA